jgi:hypothetical protein
MISYLSMFFYGQLQTLRNILKFSEEYSQNSSHPLKILLEHLIQIYLLHQNRLHMLEKLLQKETAL